MTEASAPSIDRDNANVSKSSTARENSLERDSNTGLGDRVTAL